MFTLRQVLNFQWLFTEGFKIRIDGSGRVWYADDDFKIKCEDEAELDVTELFMLSGSTPEQIGTDLSDFMHERHCPECESYCDIAEIRELDSDYNHHHQMCGDCCIDQEEAKTDPYTLRGLHRSDFY
jgi:hypothetical protein